MKYDVLTAVLPLPPSHLGAENTSQKLNRQGIRSADHWHTEHSPDNFKDSVLLIALFILQGKGLPWFRLAATEGERLYSFLNSALDGVDGQRQAPATVPTGTSVGSHHKGGWVGLRAGLDGCAEDNISVPKRPPLWSSGQSFWLQIQRSRVPFPALPDFSE